MAALVERKEFRIGIAPTFLPFIFMVRRDDTLNRYWLTIDFDAMRGLYVDDADPLQRIMLKGKPTGFTLADVNVF